MSVNISTVTSELHKAFRLINNDFFDGAIKEPAITIQSKGNRKNVLGWCTTAKIWLNGEEADSYEINIVAEYLDRGYESVMTTLTHEMIHLYHIQNNIKDVSRGGTYHNKIFKAKAEEIGFEVTYNDKIGFSWCTQSNDMKKIINNYDLNKELFNVARYAPDVDLDKRKKKAIEKAKKDGHSEEDIDEAIKKIEKEKKKKKTYIKYRCPECGVTIRATKIVCIRCEDCNELFVEED